eukprot:COSAG02_NODE_14482_length_1267_cov_1.185788_1_plen_58_part_10
MIAHLAQTKTINTVGALAAPLYILSTISSPNERQIHMRERRRLRTPVVLPAFPCLWTP